MPGSYNQPILFATAAAVLAAVTYYAISSTKTFSDKKSSTDSSSRESVTSSVDSNTAISKDLQEVLKLPLIELSAFFNRQQDPARYRDECQKVAKGFHEYGLLVVKDPRVEEIDNDTFLDMMERYFEISDGKVVFDLCKGPST